MAVITRLFFRGTDDLIVRRAPRNKVYLVEAINLIFQEGGANSVYILNRHMKVGSSPVVGQFSTNMTKSIMAVFDNGGTTNTAASLWVGDINETTKYISVAYENSNSVRFGAIIYGKIIKATKSDLIWEFITKRHR